MSLLLHTEDSLWFRTAAWEMTVAKNAGDLLNRHYPNHLWAVNVRGGIVTIKNLYLSGKMGYTINLVKIFSASELDQKVKIAGGEILERYKMPTKSFNADRWSGLSKNFAGNFVPQL